MILDFFNMDRKYLEVFNTFGATFYDEWNKCEFLNVVFILWKVPQPKKRKYQGMKLSKFQKIKSTSD